jgi:dTDP-4-dehydrorhamnose reductase
MKRRVLILGEHGQVARALVRAYAGRGDSFICAGRASLDITNRSLLASTIARFRPNLVVNAGAYTQVDKAEEESEQAS